MSKSKRSKRRPSLKIRDLERRILLSATWIDTSAVEDSPDIANNAALDSQSIDATLNQLVSLLQAEAIVTAPGSDQQLPSSLSEQLIESTESAPATSEENSEKTEQNRATTEPRHELIFIGEEIPDVDQLLAGIRQDANTLYDVYVVDRTSSGWTQLQSYLAESTIEFDAIHLVTHGTNMGFQFGADWVNADTLQSQAYTLASISHHLSEDADLLLYGCSIAETEIGQNIVDRLAYLTSTDAAASSN